MQFDNFTQESAAAVSAVRCAAVVCRNVRGAIAPDVLEKSDRSPVTVADFAAQAVICRTLREAFPADAIVAEESASILSDPEHESFLKRIGEELERIGISATAAEICQWKEHGGGAGGTDRFWTLDPIDGTKGFLRGGQYAISLALIVEGSIEAVALACPNLSVSAGEDQRVGMVFFAVRGKGAWGTPLDGDAETIPLRVTRTTEASTARFCESVESGHSAHDVSAQIAERLGISAAPIRMDSQAKYAAVARGDADIYLRLPTCENYREKIWDHAGGVLIVEEAGGRVTDAAGKPLEWTHGRELTANRGVIVTNGLLHEAVISAVCKTGTR